MCKQSGRRSSRTTKKPPAQDLKKKTPDFKTKPEKGNSKRKCKYCGKQMHNKRQDCPAFGSTCHKCKKSNYFALVCNSTRRDQVNTVEDENDLDSDLSVLTVDVVKFKHSRQIQDVYGVPTRHQCLVQCDQSSRSVYSVAERITST